MGTGIYAIANLGTVRLYVGQVTHLKTRWPKMMAQLDDGKFPNPIVQSAWETHKAERRFTFHTAEDLQTDANIHGKKLFLKDIA